MKKTLLAVVACLLLAACNLEKDEKGYFLASNYCTATINGKEYIDRESYALPMQGHSPRSEWYNYTFWENNVAVDSVGMLIIHTYLEPAKGNNDPMEYSLSLYIKDFRYDEPLEGQEYAFTALPLEIPYISLDTLAHRMHREDVSLALFDVGGIGEMAYIPASGTIRFSCSDEADSTWQEHAWLDADITLRATGDTPIDFRGHLYAP